MEKRCIGKVTATERNPTTCTTVSFWLNQDIILRPFDIVRIEHISNNPQECSHSFAIVKELSYITDSAGHLANFVSSDFGDTNAKAMNERLGTTIAEADILSNSQNIEMPIRDGACVEWASPDEIRDSLGIANFPNPIPGGYMQTSNGEDIPIDFDSTYLVGPEAAHLNISGISGLASKTSYAMFLLSALQQRMEEDTTFIVFNVKGPDLLALDHLNPHLTDAQKKQWAKCNLEPQPLKNVTYLYPYANNNSDRFFTSSRLPDEVIKEQVENGKAFNYIYDVDTFIGGQEGNEFDLGREKMSLLFSDIDDPQSTMESCIHALGEFSAKSWDALREEISSRTAKGAGNGKDISIQSWRKFSRLFRTRTDHDIFSQKWTGTERRQKLIIDAIKDLRKGSVLVVDIAPLPDYLQALVFGDVIRSVFDAKLDLYDDIKSKDLGRVVIFADELNKYAPSSGGGARDRTLTRWLLETTERGRSIGVVLFGAEQFRTGVHARVLGNCSTNIYGRTNTVEALKAADYQLFSKSNKSTVTRLNQGEMLLQHSVFNTPLIKVHFPYPAYWQLKD